LANLLIQILVTVLFWPPNCTCQLSIFFFCPYR